MKISYKWLVEYIPENEFTSAIKKDVQKISEILTSVGLEVENIEKYEDVRNGLEGLLVAEVLTCEKHLNADKLSITTVDNGKGEVLKIVCGAPNVAAGQKVILAPVGATLYPFKGDPFAIKKAKIRGEESNGMLCAEDEIGLSGHHDGIIVLPPDTKPGTPAGEYYQVFTDWVFEIGLTPNRMDAMSHLGVAKDICAYISHHSHTDIKPVDPFQEELTADDHSLPVEIQVNPELCERYAGVSLSGIRVGESPAWLRNKLKSIGLRPLNNVVDVTNFILHETGQPLHAFDASVVKGKIVVDTLPEGTPFVTLDGKERKLHENDIMICNADRQPMCIAGVFGGEESGVSSHTTAVFLESAVFNPMSVRKTMLAHNLRTDAAARFEKGINISLTVKALKRAALLIKETAGGKIASEITDIYPQPRKQQEVTFSADYIKKISGKSYSPQVIRHILTSLNFTILHEEAGEFTVAVPYSNPDIRLPADIVEEVMRIDGLDNIDIPATIEMAASTDEGLEASAKKEKIISWLTGNGFREIFTNSITNSEYFDEKTLGHTIRIINSLSEGLNVLRPDMLPSGLETISYNLNRKNNDLFLFEFGKTYRYNGTGRYEEFPKLAIYCTGSRTGLQWKSSSAPADIFYLKGICRAIASLAGLQDTTFETATQEGFDEYLGVAGSGQKFGLAGKLSKKMLDAFSIRQPVYYACIDWDKLMKLAEGHAITYEAISKFPPVSRDLAIVVDKKVAYAEVEELVKSLQLSMLDRLQLFDVFENEKLGKDKKSLAVNFTFSDREKTLTDKEVEAMMTKITAGLEKNLHASIRSNA